MNTPTALDRAGIVSLLESLSDELAQRATQADIFLVGGAAMALAYDARRATRDLDGVFAPTAAVRQAAAAVAEDHGLEEDWLNDAVKGFLPGPDPDPRLFFETRYLRVSVASPRYLLAMKLRASRVDTDVDDIRFLMRECGFNTVEDGLELLQRSYPAAVIEPKTQYLLAEIVETLTADEGDPS
ncbi:DUF6036 family nucleotidyltransferase [Phytoactinopolyspora limicola]|uniref:DUF6036 family nucleotidyltransferase n=1 Tax=Phytoactinopolyspora limicola TaxID=2715536 RepID=UPI0014093941|nr:DUF6036 family nucleotidyltransferase [Phytoactinopolyspora limicola]